LGPSWLQSWSLFLGWVSFLLERNPFFANIRSIIFSNFVAWRLTIKIQCSFHPNHFCQELSRVRVCVTIQGIGLEIGFIDRFETRLVSTLNYRGIDYLRTLQITTARSLLSSTVVPW
jgi:hypothetical protein